MAKLQSLAFPRYNKLTITQDALGNDIETLAVAGAAIGKAINATVQLTTSRAQQYADNGEGEIINEYTGGTVTIGVDEITLPVKADMMGNTITDGELVTAEGDIAPYLRFGYLTEGITNKVKHYLGNVFMKSSFAPGSESYQTRGQNSAFQTDTVSGMLSKNSAKQFKKEKSFTTEAAARAYINSFLNILENIIVSSAAGATGKTAITVNPGKLVTAHTYVSKTAASVDLPVYGAVLSAGWTAWDGTAEITATTGHEIVIAEIDAASKAVACGKATVVSG
ncbi:MAG: major tail protein [Eubacteriales bacterium]